MLSPFLLLAALAFAADPAPKSPSAKRLTPAAELIQVSSEIARSPYDDALRERAIALAAKLRPAPEIPEEARRAFIMGETLFKSAKKLRPAYEAAIAFRKATTLAPWWRDAYWNLALAQQLIGFHESAKRSLKLYIAASPAPQDQRAAKDRLYAVEAEQLAAKSAAADGLAGFWQKSSHLNQGTWVPAHPEAVNGEVFEFIGAGTSYEVKSPRSDNDSLSNTSFATLGATAESIDFEERFRSDYYNRTTTHRCRMSGATLECASSFTDKDGTQKYSVRFAKRGNCERVGEPGVQGYPIVCK